jgi:hypothetical protein
MSMDDLANIVCPECGGDVCKVDRIDRVWPHKSLVVPRILWIVFLGIFLVISTPWIGSWLGSSTALRSSTQQSQDYGVRVFESLLSGKTVQDASRGDEGARHLVLEELTTVDKQNQRRDPRTTVRFDFVDPGGVLYTGEHWGLGGKWITRSENIALEDIRDSSVVDEHFFGRPFNNWTLFSLSRYQTGGGKSQSFRIEMGNILGIIATCLAVVYLIRLVGRRLGVAVVSKRHSRAFLFVVLVVGVVVFAFNNHTTISHRSVRGKANSSTAWYSVEEIHEAIQNTQKADQLLDEIAQAIPAGDPDDWLLGKTSDRGFITHFTIWEVAFGPLLKIGTGSHIEYSIEQEDGTTTRVNRPAGHHNGFGMHAGLQYLAMSWAGKQSVAGFSMNLTQVILGIVLFYWLWKIDHGISRFVFYRFERRRTRRRIQRNQCIFCAYPLSDEGINARALARLNA